MTFQPANELRRLEAGVAKFEAGRTYKAVRVAVGGLRVDTVRSGKNVGKPYLTLTLQDRTGDRDAKCWDGADLAQQLAPGTVVEIARIDVDDFGPKFEARDLRALAPGSFDPAEFVPSLPLEVVEANWRELHERLDGLENPHLVALREALFEDPEVAAKYKTHPSAVRHHHNYLGGNVQHVLGILRVADAVCQSYRELDRDLVVFGAVVHDLGKLREYAVDTTIRVTDEGRLRGHLVIGAEWLPQIAARVSARGRDVPKGLLDHLVHMILSHHRKGEWGSPKPPATPEAMVLHLADYADSQAKGFLQDLEGAAESADGWAQRWDSDAGGKLWMRTRRDWE